jgi:hypothetical protein
MGGGTFDYWALFVVILCLSGHLYAILLAPRLTYTLTISRMRLFWPRLCHGLLMNSILWEILAGTAARISLLWLL